MEVAAAHERIRDPNADGLLLSSGIFGYVYKSATNVKQVNVEFYDCGSVSDCAATIETEPTGFVPRAPVKIGLIVSKPCCVLDESFYADHLRQNREGCGVPVASMGSSSITEEGNLHTVVLHSPYNCNSTIGSRKARVRRAANNRFSLRH